MKRDYIHIPAKRFFRLFIVIIIFVVVMIVYSNVGLCLKTALEWVLLVGSP